MIAALVVIVAVVFVLIGSDAGPGAPGGARELAAPVPAEQAVQMPLPAPSPHQVQAVAAAAEPPPAPAPAEHAAESERPAPLPPDPAVAPLLVDVVQRASGNPVPDVRVVVRSLDGAGGTELGTVEGVTDRMGHVRLEPRLGALEVTALSPSNALGRASLLHTGDGAASVRVELEELVTVGGVVTTSEGAPIPGVAVSTHASSFARLGHVVTDAEGRFAFPAWVVGSATMLSFDKAGFGREHVTLIVDEEHRWARLGDLDDIEWRSDPPFLEVVLHAAKTVRGRLVDERGAAVGGATVRARGTVDSSFVMGMLDEAEAHSDAEGRFVLQSLRADAAHTILCEQPAVGVAAAVAPAGEGLVELGDVPLLGLVRITARVVDARDAPAAGALVEARLENVLALGLHAAPGDVELPLPALTSACHVGRDGRFELLVPPLCDLTLSIRLGMWPAWKRALASSATDTDLGVLRLEEETRSHYGHVLDPSGAAVVGGRIELVGEGGVAWARTETDARGRFDFVAPARARDTVVLLRDADGRPRDRWRRSLADFPVVLESSPAVGAGPR